MAVLYRYHITAGKTRVTEPVAGGRRRLMETFQRKIRERIRADGPGYLFRAFFIGDKLFAGAEIDAVEAGEFHLGAGYAEMHLFYAGRTEHLDDAHRCRSAHDGILDKDDAFPLEEFRYRREFEAHTEPAYGL